MLWEVKEEKKNCSTATASAPPGPSLLSAEPRWGCRQQQWARHAEGFCHTDEAEGCEAARKMRLDFTSTCGKFLSEVLPQGRVQAAHANADRAGGGRWWCHMFPLGSLFYFWKKKKIIFRFLCFFLFSFYSQGTFSGNYYNGTVGKSLAPSVCVLSLSWSLCLQEESTKEERKCLHG